MADLVRSKTGVNWNGCVDEICNMRMIIEKICQQKT